MYLFLHRSHLTMISLGVALALLPCLNALCLINTCSSWVNKHRTNVSFLITSFGVQCLESLLKHMSKV